MKQSELEELEMIRANFIVLLGNAKRILKDEEYIKSHNENWFNNINSSIVNGITPTIKYLKENIDYEKEEEEEEEVVEDIPSIPVYKKSTKKYKPKKKKKKKKRKK